MKIRKPALIVAMLQAETAKRHMFILSLGKNLRACGDLASGRILGTGYALMLVLFR